MKNEVQKIRNADSFYTKISSALIRDMRLSNGAFRLMSLILADNDEFAPVQWWLGKQLEITKRTTRKYMAELIEYGYIERKRIQGGWHYKINEIPLGTKNEPCQLKSHRVQKRTPVTLCTLTKDQDINKEPLDNRSFSDPTNDLKCRSSISNHPLFPKDTFVPTVNAEGNKVIIDIEEKPSMSLNEDLDIEMPEIEMNFLIKDEFSGYLTNS